MDLRGCRHNGTTNAQPPCIQRPDQPSPANYLCRDHSILASASRRHLSVATESVTSAYLQLMATLNKELLEEILFIWGIIHTVIHEYMSNVLISSHDRFEVIVIVNTSRYRSDIRHELAIEEARKILTQFGRRPR